MSQILPANDPSWPHDAGVTLDFPTLGIRFMVSDGPSAADLAKFASTAASPTGTVGDRTSMVPG